jgi:hypothetical protein
MTKKELHSIRYTFDKNEIAQKVHTACEEKKSVNSNYKAKIDEKDSIVSLLSSHITNGYEIKTVECEVEYDYDAGLKRYFFQGVLYDTRSMDDTDRQLDFNN